MSDSSSKKTTDHEEIRRWAEQRDGHPAFVEGTGGLLRIDFGKPEERLDRVDWDQWFRVFDERGLTFLYQDKDDSTFNKLIDG